MHYASIASAWTVSPENANHPLVYLVYSPLTCSKYQSRHFLPNTNIFPFLLDHTNQIINICNSFYLQANKTKTQNPSQIPHSLLVSYHFFVTF